MHRHSLFGAVFRHRGVLLIALSIPIAIEALRGGGLVPELAWSGVAIAVSGVWLRLLAMRQIGRSARVSRPGARKGIVWSGPYRWSRNPLYLAATLMLCGLALLAGNPWLAAALIPIALLAYTPVVLVEENVLRALPGDDYRQYCATVPRWIGFPPRTSAAAADLARAEWGEVFRRERGLVPGVLFALVGIAAVRGEWVPIAPLARRVEHAVGFDYPLIVIAVMSIAIAVTVLGVEMRTHRRRAPREGGRGRLTPG